MFKAFITKSFLILISILSFSAGNVSLGMIALLGIPVAIIYFGAASAYDSEDNYKGAKRNENGFFTDNRGDVNPSLSAYKPKYTLESDKKGETRTTAGIGLVASASAFALDDHADSNASFFDDYISDADTSNPATGLPMHGAFDSAGNPLGTDGSSGIGFSDDSCVSNPANGLPMAGGIGGTDSAGNTFGHDNINDDFSQNTLDVTDSLDIHDSFDTSSSFDSSNSLSSFEDNW
ncbi:hypothetical protein AVL55_11155 [Alteromonas macleodii]|uniref:Uncharacterized protein n=1 Tax=Alteromonas macleodii TaxID=28108 RepID=A0A126Q039_ALTMA|nr:hypothetical protein [Alteromonas macleodii]AMJ98676.1 hypothetical protein AVL55_11155 [Alteromonas macleodii]